MSNLFYSNPGTIPDAYSGREVDTIFVTTWPTFAPVVVPDNIPNGLLFPQGAGQFRYLIFDGTNSWATPWTTITGQLDSYVRPLVPATVDVFPQMSFNLGFSGSLSLFQVPSV